MTTVCVLGLGYIGLPTASIFATHGFDVVGVDVNEKVVARLKAGEPHIHEPGLRTLVEAAVRSGRLRVTLAPEKADAFIIAVPTPITEGKKADMHYVQTAAESLLPVLCPGNLVVLESTSPPRTTIELLVPILARSGLKVGEDLYVAYCPERVLPGRILTELVENDRVIGGVNPESAERARALYSAFVGGEFFVTDATTAEMVKLAENTFRDVNIALANELALICEELGIDVWEAIALANRHPRVNIHRPGPGVGGHCIPIDPWFIAEKSPERARLIRLSREINDQQPLHVLDLIAQMTKDVASPKVGVLGVSYKANVDDARESPAKVLVQLLKERGYTVAVHDACVGEFEEELVSLEEAFSQADCAVVMADHDQYRYLDPDSLGGLMRHKQILDTRNVINAAAWRSAGFLVKILGSGERL
jgi:UDP-N-acetyl-D-mannosaminuronic acid dehydrogenase